MNVLRYAAGNFYINDKPTGAVVGQQPFGGSRAVEPTTKRALRSICYAGSRLVQSKKHFAPPHSWGYGFLGEK